MATQIGRAHIFGLGTCLIVPNIAGTTNPNTQGGTITHEYEVDRIKSIAGEFTGLISSGENLSCEFTIIPEGGTLAGAAQSAALPAALTGVTITGLQQITIGQWTDAFNVTGSTPNNSPWIYEGGGRINFSNSEKWTMTLPLKRYPSITNVTAVT